MTTICYLALGSNIEPRDQHLQSTITALGKICEILAQSPIYHSAPKYFQDQSPFLNMVVKIKTDQPPAQLLQQCKSLEETLGRTPTFRNGPRVIDIDILLYADSEYYDQDLSIPHEKMHERGFVLRPLCDIIDDRALPRYQASAHKLCSALDKDEIASLEIWHND